MQANRTMSVFILLCVVAEGLSLDVCASCHASATCDDKEDGSGKVCNCMYGFVGNGRSYCIDKDECLIGSSKICGQHTTCHNTYGSYYCTCLAGYSPSNNLAVFIPNDGTHCQDVDECRIVGLCGDGGQCRNLEGGFDCSCQLGYQVHNGTEPFHPDRDDASCKVDDCGQPAPVEGVALLSITGTTYSAVAMLVCDEGFVWRSGGNSSVCGADGLWTGPTMVCEEVDCGSPPALPHSHMLWNKSTRIGTEVLYECDSGYHHVGMVNISVCTAAGQWEGPSLLCEETLCGSPPTVKFTEQVWDSVPTPGSTVLYICTEGFYNKGGHNVSVCNENGQWTPPTLSCQEKLCGDPPVLPHTGRVWNGVSSPGSTVTYYCRIGFYHTNGNNISLCTNNGYWTQPNVSCKEFDCGVPPPFPHSIMLWDNVSTVGSRVVYQCEPGYHNVGGGNVSVCTASGKWDAAAFLCQEIICQDPVSKPHVKMQWDGSSHVGSVVYYQCEEGYNMRSLTNYSVCGDNGLWEESDLWCEEFDCGVPPPFPHSIMLWDNVSTVGSHVVYQCEPGYHNIGGGNVSVCTASGKWDAAALLCQEIDCQDPVSKPHVKMQWDGSTHVGSVVYYQCEEGYNMRSLTNYSVCGDNGLWEETDLWCEEISCGPPLSLPHTNLLWDGTSRPGSVLLYECMDGFYQESGNNISTCLMSGEWGEISVTCKAKCGPVRFPANSEVVWYNRSAVIHRCVDGYHSWRGSNVSVCGSSGLWQEATLRCIQIKPPINHLFVLNEKCLHWKAEKYEEDIEVYQVTYTGSRDYQRSFRDKRKHFLKSNTDSLELCLNLLPVTNYSITITAVSARFTAAITTNTSLPVPPAPVVYYREFETPLPTLRLRRSANTLDPISLYQVFVLPVDGIMLFDCSSPVSSDPSKKQSSPENIKAQIHARHVGTEMNFTVGDGLHYGGFFNAPLENGRNYYIILRADLKSSCVLWAKVRGTSYILRVSSLSAAAVIGLVALVILGGYSFTWCFKKT